MEVIPALDIREGACVQLIGGDIRSERLRRDNPHDQLEKFIDDGASRVHIVDLDAALGAGSNKVLVESLIDSAKDSVAVQVGGGIRTFQNINDFLEAGADKVVLGTRAVKEEEWLERAVGHFGKQILVALDAKDDVVMMEGWRKRTKKSIVEIGELAEDMGAGGIIYTDIRKEGRLDGPNIEMCSRLARHFKDMEVIASGGVKDRRDLIELAQAGVDGAVVGTAVYTGSIVLKEVLSDPNFR